MEELYLFGPVLLLLGVAAVCAYYAGRMALAKGYDRRMFMVLGFLMSLPVFLILYLLPDNRLPDRR